MLFRETLAKRCLLYSAVAAAFAWFIGASPWTARLTACGLGQKCFGGCINAVSADGRYVNLTGCLQTQKNVFGEPGQAILGLSYALPAAGQNVSPVTDGNQVLVDTNPPDQNLPCNALKIQVSAGGNGNPTQLIDHLVCPGPGGGA